MVKRIKNHANRTSTSSALHHRRSGSAKGSVAEDAWISRDPERVSLGYSLQSQWWNRVDFIRGREIIAFLTHKCSRELDYHLVKKLWRFRENRIAVRFAYEWHDDSGNWFRSFGNETGSLTSTA
jgi:uncharacterized protein